jgi:origin recognition complex subunit 3
MSSTLEDISILYHLYQECGRLINLQDWFDAFKVIISQDGKSHEAIHLQSRFIKGVHELQFLGFIKPTGRKKYHVQRLTWGS